VPLPGGLEWTALSHRMWLLPQRALYWEAKGVLMVSDLHLAKAEHFRSQGLQVPPTVDFQTLLELTQLIQACRPETCLFLGDLFHSKPNKAWSDFSEWLRDERKAGLGNVVLVRGNHDRAHDAVYEAMGLDVVEQWIQDDVVCTHEPEDALPKGRWVHICGHVHPAARLHGSGRQSLRLPCFHASSTGCEAGWRMTLPAFGRFTGMHTVRAERGSQVYVVTEREVVGPWKPGAGR
jgi:uncharacterized protein